jgi:hypothetical protein
MKMIAFNNLPAQPWKNGGGVTREIARRDDASGLLWRLSFADVDRDGAFSIFTGAERVLTVVEGAGLRLRHAGGVIDARPGVPVAFSGETPINGELVSGPVRDFNLIYDPKRVRASVTRMKTGRRQIRAFGVLPLGAALTLVGDGAVAPDSFAFAEGRPIEIDVPPGGGALVVTIEYRSSVSG